MEIDQARMFCAVQPLATDGPETKAYLNRHSGQIAFIMKSHDVMAATEQWGKEAGAEEARLALEVEESPGDWLEIPSYEGKRSDDPTQFIRAFLKEHGISAKLT